MQQPGQLNFSETVKAWADIVLNKWRDKITEMKIYDTGALYESLKYTLLFNAGNDVQKIEFSYNFYGIFQDRGTQTIKQREWNSRVFYSQVKRLKEILTEKYGEAVVIGVQDSMGAENVRFKV